MSGANDEWLRTMKAQYLRDAETAVNKANACARALGEDEVSTADFGGTAPAKDATKDATKD